jgi:hypothetical protein
MNHPIDVDVKARDQHGSLHQIEIPLLANRDLLARLLYTWADLYSRQLHSGEDYSTLTPTYAIWLLGEDRLPKQRPEFAHDFRRRDTLGRPLLDHGGIWLLEPNKFHTDAVHTEQARAEKERARAEKNGHREGTGTGSRTTGTGRQRSRLGRNRTPQSPTARSGSHRVTVQPTAWSPPR